MQCNIAFFTFFCLYISGRYANETCFELFHTGLKLQKLLKTDITKLRKACLEDASLLCTTCQRIAGGQDKDRRSCPHSCSRFVYLGLPLTSALIDCLCFEIQSMLADGRIQTNQLNDKLYELFFAASDLPEATIDPNESVVSILYKLF